jgi:hypothetical protein
MEPSAFRRALRQPMPAAERDYLAAQFVGEQQLTPSEAEQAVALFGEYAFILRLLADTPQKQNRIGLAHVGC